jgi:hypothetical protein
MKPFIPTLAMLASFAAAASAQTAVTDTDGNGTYSMEELKAAYATLTEEVFKTVDANADGQVDQAELDAAIASGALAS